MINGIPNRPKPIFPKRTSNWSQAFGENTVRSDIRHFPLRQEGPAAARGADSIVGMPKGEPRIDRSDRIDRIDDRALADPLVNRR